MKISDFFLHTNKNDTRVTKLISHKLMLKAGMIKQSSSGVYIWLPYGTLILQRIVNIIKQELAKISAQEIVLPNLQPLNLWRNSGRVDIKNALCSQILRVIDSSNQEYVLPPSGEEMVTYLVKNYLQSYKNLGVILYQMTWKFRDEIRCRHGVIRAKEFLMKDAYSFDISTTDALLQYEKIFRVYLDIFKRLHLTIIPVFASSGSMGGSYSHEFHTLAQGGDAQIFYAKELIQFLNDINHNSNLFSLKKFEQFYAKEKEQHIASKNQSILSSTSIEIGHMFYLGDKYTRALSCNYQDINNKKAHPLMGCYGIGITRLIAAIIEKHHDSKGIVWPLSLSPFRIALINCDIYDQKFCIPMAEQTYSKLKQLGITVLYENTEKSIGNKFADMNLIGIPLQLIIGLKYAQNNAIEIKIRSTGKIKIFNFIAFISNPLYFLDIIIEQEGIQ